MSIFRPLLLCMLLFLVLPATGQRINASSLVIDRIVQSGNIKSVRETRHEWDPLACVQPDEYSFNPQTLTITLMRYYTTGYRRKHEYVYDSALHLTESNVYWSGCEDSTNFKVVHRYRYEYAEGKAISREFIRGDTARESARYEYNREGQLVKTTIFDH